MWAVLVCVDVARQIFSYLPHYNCILRAVCKSWRDLVSTYEITIEDKLVFIMSHGVDFIEKYLQMKSTSLVKRQVREEESPVFSFRGIFDSPSDITPGTNEFWTQIVKCESRFAKRSLIMNYIKHTQYGATWLIRQCIANAREYLAIKILNACPRVSTAGRIFFLNSTKLLQAIGKRTPLDRNGMLSCATRDCELGALEWLLGASFGRAQIRIMPAEIMKSNKKPQQLNWLTSKCNSGRRGLSPKLPKILAEELEKYSTGGHN